MPGPAPGRRRHGGRLWPQEALGGIRPRLLVAIVIAKAAIFISILFPAINALAEMSAEMPEGVAVEQAGRGGAAGRDAWWIKAVTRRQAPGEEMADGGCR